MEKKKPDNEAVNTDKAENKPETKNTEVLEKLVQARTNEQTAELSEKVATLQKELEEQRKANMTAEEVRNFEMSQKESDLAEREKQLQDKENRLIAIKAIKAAGLDDGSDMALELVDFVMAENEESIGRKVNAFGALVKKFVAAEVDKTFRRNGRNPNSGGSHNETADPGSSIAEQLGKARADKLKKSNDILKYYTGR